MDGRDDEAVIAAANDGETARGDRDGAPAGRSRADETLHSDALPDSVRCPFCGGEETEQFAAFGGQASTSQYYCRPCRSVFEFLRWR